jgi:16S rRNA G966 N2-methylase RsmD
VLVERDSTACSQLAHLIEKLKAQDRVHLVKADALAWARAAVSREGRAFNLIFLDPPFGGQLLDQALPAVLPLLAPSGQIYVESDQAISPAQAADWGLLIERKDKAGAVHYHLLRQDG